MTTIKDVAKLSGVSISTVSRVINKPESVIPKKRNAVLKAMSELDYQPNFLARALVSNKSNCIGLLVGEMGAAFSSEMMVGIDQVIIQAGKHAIITSGYQDAKLEKEAIDFLIQRQCDGLIIHSKALPDDVLVKMSKSSTPMVFINRLIPGIEDKCVFLDNVLGAQLAIRHLVRNGHKKIAFLDSSLKVVADSRERLAGYKSALAEAGIAFDESLVAYSLPDEDGGVQSMGDVLSRRNDFTAVFTYNDLMAAGAINLLQDSGISVPQQISVVGFDDIVIAKYLSPKLTTIRYPVNEMGAVAAKQVLNLMEPDKFPQVHSSLRFTPRLIDRKSVISI